MHLHVDARHLWHCVGPWPRLMRPFIMLCRYAILHWNAKYFSETLIYIYKAKWLISQNNVILVLRSTKMCNHKTYVFKFSKILITAEITETTYSRRLYFSSYFNKYCLNWYYYYYYYYHNHNHHHHHYRHRPNRFSGVLKMNLREFVHCYFWLPDPVQYEASIKPDPSCMVVGCIRTDPNCMACRLY